MLYWEIVRPADAKSDGYMGKINKIEGAQFVRFVGSLLDALRGLGSSGTPNEVFERIAENLKLADDVQNELLPSEEPRYRNQMAWEGQLGIFGNGSSITGLVMQHGNAFQTTGLRYYAGGGLHLAFYNGRRPHSSLGARTPEQAYLDHLPQSMAA